MPKTPRLLFLNRSYYPDAEATGQLLTQLCESLAAEFEVSVVAGQVNQNPRRLPHRKWGREVRGGVTIHRVWNTRFPKRWLSLRALNLATYFGLTSFQSLFRQKRPDVIVAETDPPLLCLLGGMAQRRYGCKFIVYLQDIYPDLAVALGKMGGGRLANWLRARFVRAYRQADRIVVLSQDMRQVIIEWGIDAEKVVVIPNWTDCRNVRPIKGEQNTFRQRHELGGRFVVMYSGNMGLCQGLEHVLAAAAELRQRSDILFLFIGDGSSRRQLETSAVRQQLSNVRFLDYQPEGELAQSLSAADLHLVPLDPRVSRYLMPSKLYGALASGTPVVAIAPRECELAQLVEQEEVGYVVEPGQPLQLANLVKGLADQAGHGHAGDAKSQAGHLASLGHRARQLAMNRFDRATVVDQFATLIRGVLAEASVDGGRATAGAASSDVASVAIR